MFAREAINRLLTRLVIDGITVIIVSHAFDDLPDRPVRVVVMQEGKIALDRHCSPGEVEQVIRHAGNGSNNA